MSHLAQTPCTACLTFAGRYWFGGSGRVLDGFWSGGVMVSGVLEERRADEESRLRFNG